MNPAGVMGGASLVILAAVGFGFNPFFARLLLEDGLGPELISLYRFLLPALLLCVFLPVPRQLWPEVARMLLLGVGNGVAIFAYFSALEMLPAATTILIYYTYPFFSVLIGWLFFSRSPSQNSMVAALLILIAASLAVTPEGLGLEQIPAILAASIAPVMVGAQIQYLAAPRQAMKPLSRIAWSSLGHLLVLIPLAVWMAPPQLTPATDTALWAVLGIGILSAALPQLFFVMGAPALGPEKTAIAGAVELIVAVLSGALLMGDSLGRPELTAVMLIVVALFIRDVPSTQQREAVASG